MLVTKPAVTTDAGIGLQLRNMSGEQLEFTKLEVGSGQYSQDEATAETLRKRTALKAKKQQFGISSMDVSSDKTTLILSSMITNTDLKEGYTIRELGLYARIKDQPDTECLVSVSLAEIEDEIPPYDGDPESRILMKYQFAVSDSDTVSLSYEHDPVALVEDVDAKVARLLEKTKTIQSELENVKKELIGVVKQTAIVNNNTTTEAGFALDARQANPNIAGTLAANILQLNNDFSGSLNNKADIQCFQHDAYNSWVQTPLRENKYISRLYVSFDEFFRSYIGTQLIDSNGVESEFVIASSSYGFIPSILDQSKDLNDIIGNRFLQVQAAKNAPRTNMNFFGFSISWVCDNGYAVQVLFCPNEEMISGSTTPRAYIRAKNNNVWTDWNVVKGTLFS